ncbi:MAG: helix-turn-helix transcriptional regulator [Rubrobacter sp.]|nr:helix-turn-helix transcriptional regulator [Rubrobacter sp.]
MVPNEPDSVFERGSRSRQALELVADRWAILILYALSLGTLRHSQLHRQIQGISQKMLTKTLRGLERDGLISRKVYPVVPPKVEYSLTSLGRDLMTPLSQLCIWAEDHIEEVKAARADHDARENET